jgi:hypothetical protein
MQSLLDVMAEALNPVKPVDLLLLVHRRRS